MNFANELVELMGKIDQTEFKSARVVDASGKEAGVLITAGNTFYEAIYKLSGLKRELEADKTNL